MIPTPPGIKAIKWGDAAKMGETPARCYRSLGIIEKNPAMWHNIHPDVQQFIIAHEAGHIVANTRDEFKADDFAFNWCVKHGMSLKRCVMALTRTLTYPDNKPKVKNEQEARTKVLIKKALDYDYNINKNEKAKLPMNHISEKQIAAYEDSFLGLGKGAQKKREAKANAIEKKADAKLIKAQAELKLAEQGIAKGLGGVGQGLGQLGKNMGAGGGDGTGSNQRPVTDPNAPQPSPKIMGMPATTFYLVVIGAVLIVGLCLYFFVFKK